MEQYIPEIKFIEKCINLKINLSQPIRNTLSYDFIADNGHRLFRIQVKSCLNPSMHGKKNRYRVDVHKGSSKNKRAYLDGSFDYYAIYLSKDDVWYIIPFANLMGYKWANITLDKSNKYNSFKENWDCLLNFI